MTEIQAIDKQTVHQICSGQVILSLATAVKELLENSLDAGATSIEIRLKEYGLSRIEVIDNGCGVEEKNFEGLTLKHHTSKLQDFCGLASVETFGFRGEALSSLCALCKLTITTKHRNSKTAHKIEYDSCGKILRTSLVARQPGTNVVLSDIFHTLPVRHKEFKKNIKREYMKLLGLLHGYCLILTGVRISCCNETEKGNRSTVLATAGAKSIIDNISTIFGSKQCSSLLVFKQLPPSVEVCETYFLKHEQAVEASEQCHITGYISSCGPGMGRSSGDRQFFAINNRPCELQRVAKVVNEVFHMFNRYQAPFVQLDVSTRREEVDVNVTPDKRQIFIQQEKLILAIIKTSLLAMFNEGQHTIGGMTKNAGCKREEKSSSHLLQSMLPVSVLSDSNSENQARPEVVVEPSCNMESKTNSDQYHSHEKGISFLSQFSSSSSRNPSYISSPRKSLKRRSRNPSPPAKNRKIDTLFIPAGQHLIKKEECQHEKNEMAFMKAEPSESQQSLNGDCAPQEETDSYISSDRPAKFVKFSFSQMKSRLKRLREKNKSMIPDNGGNSTRSFKAKICMEQNGQAEAELAKYFTKESFTNAQVIGQFNLGFVIVRHENDIFIIDQHASDEKYNFETLQKNTVLHGQTLIIPQKLELTAADKLVLQENMSIFNKNGFTFEIGKDEDTQQEIISLVKVPSSRNWTFDASDVAEMIFMLTDTPSVHCRPSRVRQMFASRACRKSIMIGTALTRHEMRRIVDHMSEMDQPWNCPHGRPTMRHLVDLSMISGHN